MALRGYFNGSTQGLLDGGDIRTKTNKRERFMRKPCSMEQKDQ